MIEFKTTKGQVQLLLEGQLGDLIADSGIFLVAVYDQLNKHSMLTAAAYRRAIIDLMADGKVFDMFNSERATAHVDLDAVIEVLKELGRG